MVFFCRKSTSLVQHANIGLPLRQSYTITFLKTIFPKTRNSAMHATYVKTTRLITKVSIGCPKKIIIYFSICNITIFLYVGDLKKHITGVHINKMNQRRYKD